MAAKSMPLFIFWTSNCDKPNILDQWYIGARCIAISIARSLNSSKIVPLRLRLTPVKLLSQFTKKEEKKDATSFWFGMTLKRPIENIYIRANRLMCDHHVLTAHFRRKKQPRPICDSGCVCYRLYGQLKWSHTTPDVKNQSICGLSNEQLLYTGD